MSADTLTPVATAIPAAPGSLSAQVSALGLAPARGRDRHVDRVLGRRLPFGELAALRGIAQTIAVSEEFARVCDYFRPAPGAIPAGFRPTYTLQAEGLLEADLVRDISYGEDGVKRPTNALFSADTANPYELRPIAPLLANLTCNPGIIYDLFINDPKANPRHAFSTRDEVIAEIGSILRPGCDVSVELNNPFEPDFDKILAEAERFKEILSPWRVVIKVPHTGPVTRDNYAELLSGDRRLAARWDQPSTESAFLGHNLALRLHEAGYRVNFTLTFEPHQTELALQARPYFINAFIRHRLAQTRSMVRLLANVDAERPGAVDELRSFLVGHDYLSSVDGAVPVAEVVALARSIVRYRGPDTAEDWDGLGSVRHALRLLRSSYLPDTRLIVCSMEGRELHRPRQARRQRRVPGHDAPARHYGRAGVPRPVRLVEPGGELPTALPQRGSWAVINAGACAATQVAVIECGPSQAPGPSIRLRGPP